MGDAFRVKQDSPGLRIRGEIIEHIAEIDIGHIAERDNLRKADAARRRPVEHRGDHRARLTDQGDVSRRCGQVREGRVEPDSGHHDADAVRAQNPQEVRLCHIKRGLLQDAAVLAKLAKTGGNNDGGARPPLRQLAYQRWHGLGRRGDDREIGRLRQTCDSRINAQPFDRLVIWVDEH